MDRHCKVLDLVLNPEVKPRRRTGEFPAANSCSANDAKLRLASVFSFDLEHEAKHLPLTPRVTMVTGLDHHGNLKTNKQ